MRKLLPVVPLLLSINLLTAQEASNPDQRFFHFRENQGQWDNLKNVELGNILYQGVSGQSNVYFMENGLSFGTRRPSESNPDYTETMVWNLKFKGANSGVLCNGIEGVDSKTNYLIGKDKSKHARNVPDYKEINYKDLYNGIDLKYSYSNTYLKSDFIVHPGAEVEQIVLEGIGLESVGVNRKGEIEYETPWGILAEAIPYSYQMINGELIPVRVQYEVLGRDSYGFEVIGSYDKSHPLVIDPVIMKWGTFVGGNASRSNGYLYGMKVDDAGYIYGAGFYNHTFPTTPGVYQEDFGNGAPDSENNGDVYVFKLKPDGSNLEFATYIGGYKNDWGRDIELDDAGDIYVTGSSWSFDFPTTAAAYDTTFDTLTTNTAGWKKAEAFVLKLRKDGTDLIYSTLIGGRESGDEGSTIAVNSAGEAFVGGYTRAPDFPTTPTALDTSFNGGQWDAFLLKLNAAGSDLIYSTLLGDDGSDETMEIEVDNVTDEVVVTGYTNAKDNTTSTFPTTPGTIAPTYQGGFSDVFLFRMNAAGTALVHGTFIGGSSTDGNGRKEFDNAGLGLKLMPNGDIYMTGHCHSSDFPVTTGAFDESHNGAATDWFACKIKPDMSAFDYCTFIGGSMHEHGDDIDVNEKGEAFISGRTVSTDFPLTCGAAPSSGTADVIFVVLDAAGVVQKHGSIWGGDVSNDYHTGIELITSENCTQEVVLHCTSHSSDFPVTAGSFQSTKFNGHNDQPVVFKLVPDVDVDFDFVANEIPGCAYRVDFTEQASANCIWDGNSWTPDTWFWDFGNGNTSTERNPSISYFSPGTYDVKLVVGSCPKDSVIKPVFIGEPSLVAEVGNDTSICNTNPILLGALNNGDSYLWSTGETTRIINANTTGVYWVQVTSGTCIARDTAMITFASDIVIDAVPVTTGACDRFGSFKVDAKANVTGGTEPYTYVWNDVSKQTTQTAIGLVIGTYVVTVTDANGCSGTDSVTISSPMEIAITIDAEPSCGTCTDGQVTASVSGSATPPYTFRWDDPAEQTTATATGLGPGKYQVTVTDSAGCFDTLDVQIGIFGIATEFENNLEIFPNPSSGSVQLKIPDQVPLDGSYSLRIYSITGTLVEEISAINKHLFRIDLGNVSSGLYLVNLRQGNKVISTGRIGLID